MSTRRPTTKNCTYCIGGYMPNGISPTLGPIYTACKYCEINGTIPVCPGCRGHSSFPVDYTCLHCLSEHLDAHGLAAVLCPICAGITELIPLDSIPPEEPQ
jgi:hypothetical protein